MSREVVFNPEGTFNLTPAFLRFLYLKNNKLFKPVCKAEAESARKGWNLKKAEEVAKYNHNIHIYVEEEDGTIRYLADRDLCCYDGKTYIQEWPHSYPPFAANFGRPSNQIRRDNPELIAALKEYGLDKASAWGTLKISTIPPGHRWTIRTKLGEELTTKPNKRTIIADLVEALKSGKKDFKSPRR